MFYSFDIDIAKEYGVDEAIMIANFQHWIAKNKANNKNFHDGHYWTYNSKKAFTELFPFWSEQNIKTILKHLKERNVIIAVNHNENTYDRTLWYAFIDEEKWLGGNQPMHRLELTNGMVKTNQPIPDSKPDIYNNIIINRAKDEKCGCVCQNGNLCLRPGVFSINDKTYCGQHFRIALAKRLKLDEEKGKDSLSNPDYYFAETFDLNQGNDINLSSGSASTKDVMVDCEPQTSDGGDPEIRSSLNEFVEMWNQRLCKDNKFAKKIIILSTVRKKSLRARLQETQKIRDNLAPNKNLLEFLFDDVVIPRIKQSPFLQGKVQPNTGYRKFEFNLEFFCRPSNFEKLINGFYKN